MNNSLATDGDGGRVRRRRVEFGGWWRLPVGIEVQSAGELACRAFEHPVRELACRHPVRARNRKGFNTKSAYTQGLFARSVSTCLRECRPYNFRPSRKRVPGCFFEKKTGSILKKSIVEAISYNTCRKFFIVHQTFTNNSWELRPFKEVKRTLSTFRTIFIFYL